MDTFMTVFSILIKIFLVYTGVISIFFLLPRRKTPRHEPKTRFAVLLAARNEEAVIASSVSALLASDYPKELFDVYVIPNNCTDNTEGAARRAGAKILTCAAPVRNKGDALRQAFQALDAQNYDAYCVFDADNLVDAQFLREMNNAFLNGAQAAKGQLKASNPGDSWVAGCYDLYFENFDLMYNRPRANLGLSAKLVGTGFAVKCSLVREMGGWHTETIAEDAEFAAQLAGRGIRVKWVPEAISYDEEPLTFRQSLTQRRRWCSGVMTVARKKLPQLWSGFFKTGNPLQLDFAVFLSMPFIQVFALVPALWSLGNQIGASGFFIQILLSILGFWVGTTAMALFLAVAGRRSLRVIWKSILLYPLFTVSWLPLQVISLFHKQKVWKPIAHGKTACRPLLPTR